MQGRTSRAARVGESSIVVDRSDSVWRRLLALALGRLRGLSELHRLPRSLLEPSRRIDNLDRGRRSWHGHRALRRLGRLRRSRLRRCRLGLASLWCGCRASISLLAAGADAEGSTGAALRFLPIASGDERNARAVRELRTSDSDGRRMRCDVGVDRRVNELYKTTGQRLEVEMRSSSSGCRSGWQTAPRLLRRRLPSALAAPTQLRA